MGRTTTDAFASPEPVPAEFAEHPIVHGAFRRVGRLRLPLGLHHSPWATLYRMPDHRLFWIVRLWEVDRPVRRCVGTSTIRRFCDVNHLPELRARVEELVATAADGDASG
ncbi:MAG: hypothetical protein L3K19_03245 [Thermoplasmata archaeon]|nr:hypothetical protein [Thermoplasmata archaeon]